MGIGILLFHLHIAKERNNIRLQTDQPKLPKRDRERERGIEEQLQGEREKMDMFRKREEQESEMRFKGKAQKMMDAKVRKNEHMSF